MEFLFGKKKTPQEILQENQRALSRLIRELDRERNHLEQQERKITADIKRIAMQGQQVQVGKSFVMPLSLYNWLGSGTYIIFTSNGYFVRLFFAMSNKAVDFLCIELFLTIILR